MSERLAQMFFSQRMSTAGHQERGEVLTTIRHEGCHLPPTSRSNSVGSSPVSARMGRSRASYALRGAKGGVKWGSHFGNSLAVS